MAGRLEVSWDTNMVGLKDKIDKLKKISTNRERKTILRKGARIVSRHLKANTPVDTGNLKKSINEVTWSKTNDYFSTFIIKKAKRDPFYAAFQNEGFVNKWTGKYIDKHKGFIKQSLKSSTPEVHAKIEAEVISFIKGT